MASINYDDSRFTELEKEETAAKNQSNSTYDSLISQSGKYYDNLINQSKEWADKQADIQNQQKDFTVQKIEQQKDQAAKDYTKEQKGAYQDYMKQTNAYGSNMQTAGQKGLGGSGWSETIQSGFYNTYQNRYAQARESYNEIVMNYNNNIKEAELQNSSALATIYANAHKEQLELALQSFTVIKDLKLAKQDKYLALDSEYNNRWRQVESQINTENALAEEIRQYNATLEEQKRQFDLEHELKKKASESVNLGGGSGGSGSDGNKSSKSDDVNLNNGGNSSDNKKKETTTYNELTLKNGEKAYPTAGEAYQKAGGGTPLSDKELINRGMVQTITYQGKTYYYVTSLKSNVKNITSSYIKNKSSNKNTPAFSYTSEKFRTFGR